MTVGNAGPRCAIPAWQTFAQQCFAAVGAPDAVAEKIVSTLIEAEALGYSTHGLHRLAYNVGLFEDPNYSYTYDVLPASGPVLRINGKGAPGPYVLSKVTDRLQEKAAEFGLAAAVVEQSEHIACAAAYLVKVIEAQMVGFITASTLSEPVVSSPSAPSPVTSNNPLAFGAPGQTAPLLFDFTAASLSIGAVGRLRENGERAGEACLWSPDGQLTDDPGLLEPNALPSILPFGGQTGRHKGFSLALMADLLSLGLSSGTEVPREGCERNTTFILILDPKAFGGVEALTDRLGTLVGAVDAGRTQGARLPGERAWASRKEALQTGFRVAPDTWARLVELAQRLGVSLPTEG